MQDFVASWADSLDAKERALFGVGTLIIGLTPALIGDGATLQTLLPWTLAFGCWVGVLYHCRKLYRVKRYQPDARPPTRPPCLNADNQLILPLGAIV
jgi:hypothetical protein